MRRSLSGVVVIGAFAALPLVQGCSDGRAEANASGGTARSVSTSAEPLPAGLARADFDVAGMNCGGCVIGTRAAAEARRGSEGGCELRRRDRKGRRVGRVRPLESHGRASDGRDP